MDLTTPAGLESYLHETEYAAADVQRLSGGFTGYVYRVVLKTPLPNGETSVVVKHGTNNMALDNDVIVGAERMDFEYKALKMIESSPLLSPTSIVQVPRALSYDADTHTLIMSDLASTRMLSAVLIECLESGDPTRIRELSSPIGAVLGDFLGRFHKWTSLPEQAELRAQFLGNTASTKDGVELCYHYMRKTTARLELERGWMDEMVQEGVRDAEEGGSVIAMGDFWLNNILVSNGPEEGLRLYVIDWELARCARPEVDVGSFAMVSWSVAHRYPSQSCFRLIQEFYKSYRKHYAVDIVQVALWSGVIVVGWGAMMEWAADRGEQTLEAIAKAGVDLLEAAQEKNTELIRNSEVLREMYTV
ncbi:hypothetical protein BDV93DRAFT_514114 [Ceratobasidium sp. AG-I]|nr:hypothetical protein BDV93DRAFT_514114 [Ceratobasidium sp. AG-I]